MHSIPPLEKLPVIVNGRIGNNPVSEVADAIGKALRLSAYRHTRPAPTLSQPVILFTGLTLTSRSYQPFAEYLASNPRNGRPVVYSAASGEFRDPLAGGRVLTSWTIHGQRLPPRRR
jgi:hypothetical protein